MMPARSCPRSVLVPVLVVVVMPFAAAGCGVRAGDAAVVAATTTTATTTSTTAPTTTTSTTTIASTTTSTTTVVPRATNTPPAPTASVASDDGGGASGVPTMVVIGDSTAAALAVGLERVASEAGGFEVVAATREGCGLVTVGEYLDDVSGGWRAVPTGCVRQVDEVIPAMVGELEPASVVVMVTSWDVAERRWTDGVETEPTSVEHAERLHAEYDALTRRLLADGAGRVAWVLPPTPNGFWVSTGERQEDDAWQQTSRDAFVAIAAADERVEAIDLEGWMRVVGLLDDVAARPDGIHLSPEAARWVGAWIYSELTTRAER